MDLVQKGSAANVGFFKQLLVTMKWTDAADFDLSAVWEAKDGTRGIVYFGDLGDMNAFPHMALDGDEGVNDTGGDNQEQLRITSLDRMKYVWILCWDYGKVQSGAAARFKDSDVKLTIMDDRGFSHDVRLDTGDLGNIALIATIDCTSPIGARLVNTSKAGTLKGLKTLEQLLEVIEG
jgi:tellurite resistance protein TerA